MVIKVFLASSSGSTAIKKKQQDVLGYLEALKDYETFFDAKEDNQVFAFLGLQPPPAIKEEEEENEWDQEAKEEEEELRQLEEGEEEEEEEEEIEEELEEASGNEAGENTPPIVVNQNLEPSPLDAQAVHNGNIYTSTGHLR
ncbi:hypothetical protein JZ751_019237 [Albula glossodonta]|uniref:Uncharacterized protein n=1 Tax=Albula glossodonta TaxID=121402 RepID=A0A8T2NV89_9TELE|nr:hypothetical protein JZ751_019237 [Albula glossodonta]